MALPKDNCEIYLTQKLNKKNHWEFRLSIREEILGTKREVLFASGELVNEFISNLEGKLINHGLKDYARIQRVSRWSKKRKKVLFGKGEKMKKVPQYVFQIVRTMLSKARIKAIESNKKTKVNFEEAVLA